MCGPRKYVARIDNRRTGNGHKGREAHILLRRRDWESLAWVVAIDSRLEWYVEIYGRGGIVEKTKGSIPEFEKHRSFLYRRIVQPTCGSNAGLARSTKDFGKGPFRKTGRVGDT